MTNLEELREVINDEKKLVKWLFDFAYWTDPGGWIDDDEIEMYLEWEKKDG